MRNWICLVVLAVFGLTQGLGCGESGGGSPGGSGGAGGAADSGRDTALDATDDRSGDTSADGPQSIVVASKISGDTREDGRQATFTVALAMRPGADVTVNFDSNDKTEGTVDKTRLAFTPVNWNAPQTVTVTGVDDDLADGNQTYAIVFSATTSTDPVYAATTPPNVTVVNVDNDTAGVTVSAISGRTGEDGTKATFTAALNTQPSANVVLNLDSDKKTEGTVDKTSLTFIATNWKAAQTVTVTGVDDALADGNQTYAIVFGATTSTDAAYAAVTPAKVDVVNVDNDTAGITVSAISGQTTETGVQATFTVVLNSTPSANVTVNFDSADKSEGTVDKTSLTFTPTNWNARQTVTVTGIDDTLVDGNQPYTITFGATTSTDAAYAAITPSSVAVTNVDNDQSGITTGRISRKTGENGTQATFTVVLNSQPSASVTVPFNSNDTTEGTVDRTSLTFTTVNWNAPQTVTVTGVDDNLADGEQTYAVVFTATTSTDPNYSGLVPASVSVINVDDDSPGISVSAISGDTRENGTQATFTVVLNAGPADGVVVHLDSNDLTEGTVDKKTLVFTAINWSAPQTVTVTGVNDMAVDGDQTYAIAFTATTSNDPGYAGITPASVPVINIDDDTAGITVSDISGPTGENGAQATFSIVLNTAPSDAVAVHFDSDRHGEGRVDRTSLTFTTVNWAAPQTVTVTGVDDAVADGNQLYHIVFGATTSNDAAYAAITPANVEVSNLDNDSPSIRVSPVSWMTGENRSQVTFTVVLGSQPTADVTVGFDSDDHTEGTVDRTSLTFTAVNWAARQTVVVTGVDDNLADGDQPYHIVFAQAVSMDAAYAAITPGNVNVINADNDSPGITVTPISGDTSEGGAQATFTVVLRSEPFADVTINFNSNDLTEGTVNSTSLTFTAVNWSAPRTVVVTGVNDDVADGDQPYSIVFTATTSTDAAYAALTPANIALANTDNDSAGITVSPISGNTTEAGGTATFTVVLNSQPFADVTVNLNSNDATEGMVDKTALPFTTVNWNAPQTVTVTGINDDLADGAQPYAIVFTPTTSTDGAYAAITPANVALSNTDNDSAGITVSPISGNTTEAGGTATFTVRLNSQPFAAVTVNFNSNDTTEGTVAVTSLGFTDINWSVPQTVTVTGVNDNLADGNQPYAIAFAPTTSTDAAYAAITPVNVDVTNTDNDTAGITVSPISGNTSEAGGTATFTVVLNSQPFSDVTVNFNSNDTSEGTLDKTSLTFTAGTSGTWGTPQTVTVTGINDDLADGHQPYAVVFTATTSADAAYAAITPANLSITNNDNDSAGIIVSAISGNTTEAGGQATFTVRLNSQPFANVTVNFNSNDTTEGTVSPTSLTFTPTDWSTPQTATVTGVNDGLSDCLVSYAIVFTATTSTDTAYAAITPSSVALSNVDDDTSGGGGFCMSHTAGTPASATTCNPWLTFTSSLTGAFSSVTIAGSNNPTGKTCSDATAATTLCNALQARTSATVTCGSDTWRVGPCGYDTSGWGGTSAMEISINGGICACPSNPNVLIVRPCIDAYCGCNDNVGGIGTATCGPPTQTMSVQCTR